MNVLVVSSMAWNDTNSIGNTFSNWFGGEEWNKDEISHLYLRNQLPDNKVCRRYYHFSVFDLADPRKKKSEVGTELKGSFSSSEAEKAGQKEGKLISRFHENPSELVYHVIDEFYRHQKWKNEKLDRFINEVKPDIVFMCVTDVSFLCPFVHYLKTVSDAAIVSYLPDDLYGQIQNKASYRRKKLTAELQNVIAESDLVYCASEQLKEHYTFLFHKKMETIYKGCAISGSCKETIGNPFRLIYAGNLFYGRDQVILKLIEAIRKHNQYSRQKFFLEICSSETISEEMKAQLNCENVSVFRGRLPYETVTRMIHEGDASVIPESFEKENRIKTRYSFSTKIPESLMSGSSILAIGPDDISSIQFLSGLPFVYYCGDIDGIAGMLDQIAGDAQIVQKRKDALLYARENFEIGRNRRKIHSQLEHLKGSAS